MSRPVGVTASAVVAILGSILALLVAVLLAATPFMATAQPQPPNTAPFAFASAAMCAALAGIGIWTSVGLFRLRSWARTSVLVIAGFAAAFSIFALLVSLAMPLPPEITADTKSVIRGAAAVMFGIPFVVAVWWLIQFNSASTKAAFASPASEPGSSRPLSITIIAWASIIGAAFGFFPILARLPVFLFGAVFNGWIAGVIYAFFVALSLYIGKGLLDLRERARILAIGWWAFGFVHLIVVTLVPSVRQRMFEMQRTIEHDQPNPIPFDQGMFTNVMLAFSAVLGAVVIWFLIRNRSAFVRAENP